MASSSPPQHAGAGSSADLARFKSSGVRSMNMDDIIRNIYDPEAVNAAAAESAGVGPAEPSLAARRLRLGGRRRSSGGSGAVEMTLEDFLARDSCGRAAVMEGNMALGFPDGDRDAAGRVAGGVGGVRGGGKRALLDHADCAVMQRQKRMKKNQESAARSRDKKQEESMISIADALCQSPNTEVYVSLSCPMVLSFFDPFMSDSLDKVT
ncbi:hypothetical protein ZEAMMB73_Zm00001d015848 [Zea mays]|uniref:Uncharacterized protein n=1 Tax=Zea mays TaxID=4577 RepID=A0A1D6H495_MAIZE|nr:hypothetical protein ZEAMMB73_Zm00001d015848 [Zea mays]